MYYYIEIYWDIHVHPYFFYKITFYCNKNNNSNVKTLKIIKGIIFALFISEKKEVWKKYKKNCSHNYA